MVLEVKDIVGLSKPLTKLIEVVSDATGALYRPRAIRAEADARAYETKVLSHAQAEAAADAKNIEFAAATDRINSMLRDHPEIAERAKRRLLAREIEGQLNVDSIADFAAQALPAAVSEDPVSPDWRRKFFLEAENVCEADLQLLWGKVLAGEIATPGAFGLRTLDTLRQLSRAEAELFRRACAIAMSTGWIALPNLDLNTSLKPFGFTYGDILSLRDAGLLLHGDHIHKDFRSIEPAREPTAQMTLLINNGAHIQLSGPAMASLQIPALVFTRAGQELQRLIEPNETPEYLRALGTALRQRGVVAKRGTPVPQGDGISVITFEHDL